MKLGSSIRKCYSTREGALEAFAVCRIRSPALRSHGSQQCDTCEPPWRHGTVRSPVEEIRPEQSEAIAVSVINHSTNFCGHTGSLKSGVRDIPESVAVVCVCLCDGKFAQESQTKYRPAWHFVFKSLSCNPSLAVSSSLFCGKTQSYSTQSTLKQKCELYEQSRARLE